MARTTRRSRQAGQHTGLGEQDRRPQEFLDTSKRSDGVKVTQQSSPLLSLPPEIRNRIYRYALGGNSIHVFQPGHKELRTLLWDCTTEPRDYEVASAIRSATIAHEVKTLFNRHFNCNTWTVGHRHCAPGGSALALLLTCRQVHQEAAAIPFESNTFVFRFEACFDGLMRWLNPAQQASIASVVFESNLNRNELVAWISKLRQLPGLRELTMFLEAGVYTSPHLWFEEDARYARQDVLHMVGRHSNEYLRSVSVCAYSEEMKTLQRSPTYQCEIVGHTNPESFGPFCSEMERLFKRAS